MDAPATIVWALISQVTSRRTGLAQISRKPAIASPNRPGFFPGSSIAGAGSAGSAAPRGSAGAANAAGTALDAGTALGAGTLPGGCTPATKTADQTNVSAL